MKWVALLTLIGAVLGAIVGYVKFGGIDNLAVIGIVGAIIGAIVGKIIKKWA